MKPQKIAIIGLGLIGGSLGLLLRRKLSEYEVIGLSRSQEKLNRAREIGVIDWGSIVPEEVLSKADLAVIATPVSLVPFWIEECAKMAKPGTIVTDVGSTKAEVVRWAEKRAFRKIVFVGAHPMAGSHQAGIESAKEELFTDSLTFVTKTRKTDPEALKRVIAFWKKISREVVVLNPQAHDRIVADISHVPHALASVLVHGTPKEGLPYAASGFLDTTRVAQGDVHLWIDIFLSNRAFVAKGLRRQKKVLEELLRNLEAGDRNYLQRFLTKAADIRKSLNKVSRI